MANEPTTKMLTGKALGIFHDINTPKFTDEEKTYAIYHVLSHLNPKAIKKDAFVEVAKYLFEKHTGIHLERNHDSA